MNNEHEHKFYEISKGFKTSLGGYSPTILGCKGCNKTFKVVIANPDRIERIKICEYNYWTKII